MSRAIRKHGWHPLVSLLLVAVLVPVQAAGCCRLAAVLGVLPGPVGQPAGAPLPADEAAGGDEAAGTGHACCPRKAAAAASPDAQTAPAAGAAKPGRAGRPCGSGDGSDGCCLAGSPHADPGLLSAESGPAFLLPSRHRTADEPLPAAPSLPALALPADSGPPLYLACRRLLI